MRLTITEGLGEVKTIVKRVAAKRASDRKRASEGDVVAAGAAGAAAPTTMRRGGGPAPAPKVGARPQRKRK